VPPDGRRTTALLLLGLAAGATTAATPEAADPAAKRAEAYFLFTQGELLADGGEIDSAERAYLAASVLDPASPEIAAAISGLCLRDGRVGEAVAWGRRAVAAAPQDPGAHKALGEALASGTPRETADPVSLESAISELSRAVELGGSEPDTLATLGRLQGQAGRLDEAVATYEKLLALHGDSSQAHLLIARALARNGRRAEAVDHYSAVLQRVPGHTEALIASAGLLEELERWKQAAMAWQQLGAVRPADPLPRMRAGLDFLRAGDPVAASISVEEGRSLDPDSAAMARLLAMSWARAGRFDEANTLYDELVAAHTGEASLLAEAAACRAESGHIDEAIALQERALTSALAPGAAGDERSEISLDLARMHLSRGGSEGSAGAIAALDKAARGGPDSRDAALLRCRARLIGANPIEAVTDCRKARRTFPDEGRFAVFEAEAQMRAGHSAEARTLLDEAAARAKSPDVIVLASGVYERAGDRARALGLLQAAAERLPAADAITTQYGALLEQEGRRDEAKAQMQRAIALNGDNHIALNYLGYMLAEDGTDLEHAQGLIERAIDLDPENGAYLDSLGWVLYRRGRAREALEPLERAAQLLGEDATVREHLGDVLLVLGRRTEAESAWKLALKLGGPADRLRAKLGGGPAAGDRAARQEAAP